MKNSNLLNTIVPAITLAIQFISSSSLAAPKFHEIERQFRKPSADIVMSELNGSYRGRCYTADDIPQGMILTTVPLQAPIDSPFANYKLSAIEYYEKPYVANDSMTLEEIEEYWRNPTIKSEFAVESATVMNVFATKKAALSVSWGGGVLVNPSGDTSKYRIPAIVLVIKKGRDGVYYGRRLLGYGPVSVDHFVYRAEQYCSFSKKISRDDGNHAKP